MELVAGVWALLAAGTAAAADVDTLQELWSGLHDSTEQVVVSSDNGINSWPEAGDRRVRVVAEPVELPWLGAHVLYFEEFLQDDPNDLRRQLLVKLEPADGAPRAVRARLFTFLKPRAWVHLYLRPDLQAALTSDDITGMSTCDLIFTREGTQFRGNTIGHRCLDVREPRSRYLDYELLIGQDLYWYRRRLLRKNDGEVQEEIIGFNWFELDTTQLYTCRIDWTAADHPQDLRPLLKLDIQDQGGHGRFVTPDGRKLEITLHSDDWPFSIERDALVLVLQDQGAQVPFAIAWSAADEGEVSLALSWLRIRCGPLVPETDELHAERAHRRPATAPG